MQHTKRKFLAGIATTVAVGAGATPVLGQSDHNVVCTEVNAEQEYVVYTNEGESAVDVSGYTVAFEYGNDDYNQRRDLPEGTTIEAGATLTVATGAVDVESDVTFDYEGEVLNNEEPDVVALLDTDGNEVCTINGQTTETETETAEPTSTESETATETEEQTETATETETVTETETETATETAEPTSTETETTATETATEETTDDSDDDC